MDVEGTGTGEKERKQSFLSFIENSKNFRGTAPELFLFRNNYGAACKSDK